MDGRWDTNLEIPQPHGLFTTLKSSEDDGRGKGKAKERTVHAQAALGVLGELDLAGRHMHCMYWIADWAGLGLGMEWRWQLRLLIKVGKFGTDWTGSWVVCMDGRMVLIRVGTRRRHEVNDQKNT